MSKPKLVIVFAVFPGLTQLSLTGPYEVLSRVPGAEVIVASVAGGALESSKLAFGGLHRLADIRACDVICVPGGAGVFDHVMRDEIFIGELRRLAATARLLTSVCTGSLVLGAAGFLRGKRATTNWAWRDLLAPFEAIADPARVVRDGAVITGGGVTAGIDFALTVAAELAGPEVAKSIQLQIEYAPSPPFEAGSPEAAPPSIVAQLRDRNAALTDRRREIVKAAAARMVVSQ
jgi:transcriptional regulator GlxA family with amidase domain